MQGKVVLITGGARRVGAAICRRLHASGASLMLHYRSSAGELAHCAAHGLAWLPWSPFGGVSAAGSLDAQAPAFAAVAEEVGASVYQVTLAWHLAQADVVIPIPGASRASSIQDSAAAADLELTPDQLTRLNAT